MSKLLVIGGGIFVGKAIAEYLVRQGHEVYALNRGTHQTPDKCKQLVADRNDVEQLRHAIQREKYDFVIDTSCMDGIQMRKALAVLDNNYGQYIYISSSAVYKNTGMSPICETDEVGGAQVWGDYGVNKFDGEEVLRSQCKQPYTIFRPFYVYGENNNLNREEYVFTRLLHNSPIILPAMGNNMIHFGYADDLGLAVGNAIGNLDAFNQVYNIAGDEVVSMLQWINICAEVSGIEPEIYGIETNLIEHDARSWFPFRDISCVANISKVKKDLKIKQFIALKDGLKKCFQYMRPIIMAKTFELSAVEKEMLERMRHLLVTMSAKKI